MTFCFLVIMVFGYVIYAYPATNSIVSSNVLDYTSHDLSLQNGQTFSQTFTTDSEIGFVGFFIKDFYKGNISVELFNHDTDEHLASGTIKSSEVIINAYNVAALDNVVAENSNAVYRVEASLDTGEYDYPVVLGYTPNATYSVVLSYFNINYKHEFFLDNEAQQGTLGMIVRTGPVGTFILKYYLAVMSIISLVAGGLVYLCLSKKFAIHKTFGIAVFVIGLVFMLVFSPYNSPDSRANINTAFTQSFRITEHFAPANFIHFVSAVYMRPNDGNEVLNTDISTPHTYKETVENFFDISPDKFLDRKSILEPSADFAEMTVFGTIAVLIARALRIGFVGALYLGRVLNLLAYSFAASFAVKKVPDFMKNIFMVFCSLPMLFNITTSFNRDNLLICLSLVFMALVFNVAYNDGIKTISFKQLIPIITVGFLLAPLKIIYFPLVALVFVVPKTKFSSKKNAVIAKLSVIAFSVVSFISYNFAVIVSYFTRVLGFSPLTSHDVPETASQTAANSTVGVVQTSAVTTTGDTLSSAVAPISSDVVIAVEQVSTQLGDAHSVLVADMIMYTPQYILDNLFSTIMLVVTTFFEKTDDYILNIFGHNLGNYNVEINLLFVFSFMFLMVLALIKKEGMPSLDLKSRTICISIVAFIWLLTLASNILWTPTYYTTIFGVLDRYILPVIPLLFVGISFKRFSIKTDISYIILISSIILNLFVIINAFTVALGR